MAPPPPTRLQIQRLVSVSTLLHGLIAAGHLVGLVFTAIAGNRDDNTTVVPSSHSHSHAGPPESAAERTARTLPTVRLVMFGTAFILYLVIKAFEISIRVTWFALKSWMDEISLLVGGLSLLLMVLISTYKFFICVALPAYVVVVFGWFLSRTGVLERVFNWLYVKSYKLEKSYRIRSRNRILKRRVLHVTETNSAYIDALKNVTTDLSGQDYHNAEAKVEQKKQILLDAIEAVVEAQDSIELCRRECDLRIEEAAITYEAPEV